MGKTPRQLWVDAVNPMRVLREIGTDEAIDLLKDLSRIAKEHSETAVEKRLYSSEDGSE